MPGYLANVLVSREDRVGAAVLVNGGGNLSPADVSLRLIDKVRERFPPEPAPWRPGEGAPEELAGVLGRWWSEGSEFIFRWRDGQLEARLAEAPDWAPWARFEPVGEDRLRTVFGRERGELLRIVRDDDGTPTKLYWATYPFTRTQQIWSGDA
jgi:hypothetical protein